MLFVQIIADVIVRKIADSGRIGGQAGRLCHPHLLANRDEFHFGRDDAPARVPELGHGMAFGCPQGPPAMALQTGKFHEAVLFRLAGELGMFAGKIAVVLRLHVATVVFRHVAALQNPIASQRGQAFLGIAVETGIAPRSGAIIDAHRFIGLDGASIGFGGCQFDFAHWHTHVGMQLARDVNLFAPGQLLAALQFERIFGCNHMFVTGDTCQVTRSKSREGIGRFLRQHYLDQVPGSAALPRHPLSLCFANETGWLPE